MTDAFAIGPLPPGVAAPRTSADRAVYGQALQLEGVFTQHLVDAMMKSAQGDDDDQSGGMGMYREMVNEQLNTALVDAGGLGLAGTLYAQMRGNAPATSAAKAATGDGQAAAVASSAATTQVGTTAP